MDEAQSTRKPMVRIDAPGLWLVVRSGQILFAVMLAKPVYLARNTLEFFDSAISFGLMVLIIALFFHRVVTGFADSSGIRYRRYFRWNSLPWSEVQEIQWKGARLRLLLRGKKKPKAMLEFLLNPVEATGSYWG